MDYRALCVEEEEKLKNKWKNDPMFAFVHFLDERKLKLFDMFKYFDKDKSCSLSKDEFITGLQVSCYIISLVYLNLMIFTLFICVSLKFSLLFIFSEFNE